ncbi:MAG: L,D-transpeptidase [Gemmatimonadota bacterium]
MDRSMHGRRVRHGALGVGASLVLVGCSALGFLNPPPPHPADAGPPVGAPGYSIWRAALASDDPRIVVSLENRRLWLLEGSDTILSAPIAVGRNETFTFKGQTFRFHTPRGRRKVIKKEENPIWVPPDWHYFEKAAYRKLEVVRVERGKRYMLRDSTYIEIRGEDVGRVNRFGNFWPFTPGKEIIFDDTIFIPPLDTRQRKVPDALGPYKLDLGDGYLIHGTHRYNRDSIGRAVSHGCIRMRNEDLERLYKRVKVGTPVYIY